MSYWDNVTEIYKKQTAKGIIEYGQTLEDNKSLDAVERITMAQEELVDLLVYLEHIKAGANELSKDASLNHIYEILHDDYKAPELKIELIDDYISRARKPVTAFELIWSYELRSIDKVIELLVKEHGYSPNSSIVNDIRKLKEKLK